MTTTLKSLSTPRPFAWMAIMFITSEIMTTVASNALKASTRNMRLLAKVLRAISVKKRVRNTLSI